MYVRIDNVEYRQTKGLSFSPEVSITSQELPINQFQIDIISDEAVVKRGKDIYLYDNRNRLWAKYWITYAERIDRHTVRIIAQSKLILLERKEVAGVMYTNYPVENLVQTLFSDIDSTEYSLDSSFQGKTISGYMGHHSKKYRLQLLCFAIGAYVKTFGTDKIEILPLDGTETLIPINKTFWKPSVKFGDYVTAVSLRAFSFAAGTPASTDEWVDAGGVTYIVSSQDFTLANPDVPAGTPDNVISFNDIQIVNSGNVTEILSRLAQIVFQRTEASVDVINNGDYWPAERVNTYLDEENIATGYIESASFSFGLQARSTLTLVAADAREATPVTIEYWYQDKMLQSETYMFPIGYNFEISTVYIDRDLNEHRYIFRPETDTATGTVQEGGTTVQVMCEVAADFYENILSIYNVDAVDVDDHELDISASASGIEIIASPTPEMNLGETDWMATVEEFNE